MGLFQVKEELFSNESTQPLYAYVSLGRAVYHASNGASEERTYVDNIPHGSATLYLTSGDTEERTYENGQLHGIATFVSNNGDRYVPFFIFPN